MSTTTVPAAQAAPGVTAGQVRLDARWVRRAARFLLVAAAWNVWVWATRAWNLVTDDRTFSVAFVVVHLTLFAISLVAAGGVARVGLRLRAAAREAVA